MFGVVVLWLCPERLGITLPYFSTTFDPPPLLGVFFGFFIFIFNCARLYLPGHLEKSLTPLVLGISQLGMAP